MLLWHWHDLYLILGHFWDWADVYRLLQNGQCHHICYISCQLLDIHFGSGHLFCHTCNMYSRIWVYYWRLRYLPFVIVGPFCRTTWRTRLHLAVLDLILNPNTVWCRRWGEALWGSMVAECTGTRPTNCIFKVSKKQFP